MLPLRLDASSVVLVATGILLLTAGTLKLYQLSMSLDAAIAPTVSTSLSAVFASFEVTLSACLVLGYKPKESRQVAIVSFVLFAVFSLFRALAGAASCGCFGAVPVNPWWTLGLDVSVVAALLISRPGHCAQRRNADLRAFAGLGFSRLSIGLAGLAIVFGFVWIGAAGMLPAISADGVLFPGRQVAVFDPADWVGKRMPLLDYIDIGVGLSSGSWTVVFYHHDCAKCLQVLPEYEQLSGELHAQFQSMRVAVVEVPPYQNGDRVKNTECTQGRLNDSKEWFLATSSEITLSNGRIVTFDSTPGRRFEPRGLGGTR